MRCYLLVAALGFLGVLKREVFNLFFTIILAYVISTNALMSHRELCLVFYFFIGAFFYVNREQINLSLESVIFLIDRIGTNPGKQEFLALCQESPLLFQEIVEMAQAHFTFSTSHPNITPELVLTLEIQRDRGQVSFINHVLKEIQSKAENVSWIAERLDQIKQAIINHKEHRLLNLMQSQGVMRARDELSRTLSELRKQQQWRLKMTAIDVTPSEES